MNRLYALLMVLVFCVAAAAQTAPVNVVKTHALSLVGSPKYAADFMHFGYANPDAPKGGTFRRAMYGGFDSFNQFASKGIAYRPPIYTNMYETLMTASYDDTFSYYGLIAESVEYPEDYSWVVFNLRKEAKWHDGTPITADDVVFSFEKITEASPFQRDYYALVTNVVAEGKHRVKFLFSTEEISKELPFMAGQLTIIPKHYWEKRDLTKSTLEPPLVSGPYKIASFEAGKRITLERVDNYWGKDLPVNKGHYNFDKLVFEFFRDPTVGFEAFKAGHFDLTAESAGARWYKGYTGRYFDMGLIIKEEIPHKNAQGMRGFVFNTSVKPLDNILVRKALTYAYDYEWINKNLYYDMDKRFDSYFSNSELACGAVPSAEVAAVIKSVKADAGNMLLKEPFSFPVSDGAGNNRDNLMTAVTLLEQAGYRSSGGKMVDPAGKQLRIEIMTSSKSVENELLNFQKALGRIGIDFYIRYLDSSQYLEKVRNKDYMMIYSFLKQSESPGNEQRSMWTSIAADSPGSRNYAKIKDPAVDALIERIVEAKDRKSLVTYCKALDRLLLAGWYVIPTGYSDRYRIAYWDKFGMPETKPDRGITFSTWWIIPEKAKHIESVIKK